MPDLGFDVPESFLPLHIQRYVLLVRDRALSSLEPESLLRLLS
jgi:hypothetical protein